MKQRKGWRMSCGVGKARKGLENEFWRRWSYWKLGEWALLYISISMSSAHSPSFQSPHLRHSSFWFSKISVTSPTSQLILQPFPRFTYVTTHSQTLPLLHLRHSSFSNPSFASPTSQDFPLLHPWLVSDFYFVDTKHYIYNYCFDQCAANKSVGRVGVSVTFVRF